ncbi:MAG: glycosyltransferase family 2 protein [Alphaproteobacteria bacterium]
MSGHSLSALVVVHNEQDQLGDCLETLGFADEILVVLDDCTDRSRDIAAGFTDRLIEGAWPIEGERRNTGIDACNGPWILEIDADERVPAALAAEISRTIAKSGADWHELPVDNHIGARLVRYGWGASFGRGAHAALFRKGAKVWGNERVHPKLTFTGAKGARLETPITHYVDRNISDMIRRLDSYSTARALDLRDSGDIGSFGHNVRRIFSRFYKCYVARRGYREGAWGFLIALLAGLYPILSYLKARLEDE